MRLPFCGVQELSGLPEDVYGGAGAVVAVETVEDEAVGPIEARDVEVGGKPIASENDKRLARAAHPKWFAVGRTDNDVIDVVAVHIAGSPDSVLEAAQTYRYR